MIPARLQTILAAAALVALMALGAWWHLGQVKKAEKLVHAHYAQVLAGISEKSAEAARKFRATETAWQTAIDKEAQDGQTRIDVARRDAVGARAERDGLRADLARFRAAARAASHSCTASAGSAASDALDLLADLFSRADETAGELAAAFDLAHAAGISCQRSYDALTQPSQPDAGNTTKDHYGRQPN